MTTPTTEQRLTNLEASAFQTGRSLAVLAGGVGQHRDDVALVRDGLALLSADGRELRQDVVDLRQDVAELRADLRAQGVLLAAVAEHLGVPVPPPVGE